MAKGFHAGNVAGGSRRGCSASQMALNPARQRRQANGVDAVYEFPSFARRIDQPGSFQALQMLNNGRSGNRKAFRKLAGGHGQARKALEDDHPDGMPEQSKHTQCGPKIRGMGMGSGHAVLSGWTNIFGKQNCG